MNAANSHYAMASLPQHCHNTEVLLQELGTKYFDTSECFAGILEYIRSKFQPICHISYSSSTATHFIAAAATHLIAGAATHLAAAAIHLAAAACISCFNYADLLAFIKLQVSTSTMSAKGKGGHAK